MAGIAIHCNGVKIVSIHLVSHKLSEWKHNLQWKVIFHRTVKDEVLIFLRSRLAKRSCVSAADGTGWLCETVLRFMRNRRYQMARYNGALSFPPLSCLFDTRPFLFFHPKSQFPVHGYKRQRRVFCYFSQTRKAESNFSLQLREKRL